MKKLLLLTIALFTLSGVWAAKTVYLEPNLWNYNAYAVYAWGGATDPAFYDMEAVSGTSYYKAEIPDDRTGMLFTCGDDAAKAKDWYQKARQTEDVTTITDGTAYVITSKDGGAEGKSVVTSTTSSYSVRFATDRAWTNIYAYAWKSGEDLKLGEWPGKKMAATAETFNYDGVAKTIYSLSFFATTEPEGIIFNNGEGGDGKQTADLTFTNNKFYVSPTTNPTDPTDPAARVIAIFSNYYEKALMESNNGWGGGPNPKFTSITFPVIQSGHTVVDVMGTAVNGRASGTLNAEYNTLHVALWPTTATSCKIWDDNIYDKATVYNGLVPGQWNYVEISDVAFTKNYIGIELYNGETPETEFYLDHFYFSKPSSGDTTPPTFDTHTLKSANCISATLTLQATDETSETITYKVVDTATSTVYQTTGASGTAIDFTISPLAGSTEYTFSVTAMDENGNETAAETINATTEAIPNIPAITAAETHLLWDGNDGGAKNGFNFYDWGGGTGSAKTINEKNGFLISNFKWFGSQFTEVDASGMTYLEIDVLPSKSTTLAIVPINFKTEGEGNQPEKGTQFNVTAGEWNKLKVPVADVIENDGVTMTRLFQIKFVGSVIKNSKGTTDGFANGDGNMAFYVGNIYAYKESGDDNEKPVMVSAALASKTHNSATLTLEATDNNSKVKFHIVDATNSINVTTGLADQGTDFEYTVTGLTAETAYNFTVTAEDAAGNVSENNKDVAVTTDAAPTGQELVNGDHKVLLNGYHDIGTENYELIITSDEVMQGLGGSYWNINGVGGTRVDANLVRSADGKTLTITATSNQDPQLYTPLYVMMPGEVNFGQPTIIWQERGAAPTPTEGYYIIGNMNDWEINNNYKLTLNEAAAPTVEYYFPSLALTTTSQFKVVYSANGTDKTIYYPDGTENDYGQHGEITADGNYTIFFRPNGDGGSDWFHNVIYVTSMIDAGEDPTTGAHILTGVWDAAKFASIDEMDKAAAYDLTGVDFTGVATPIDMVGKTANPYSLFITSTPNTVNHNEVVWDATNNRYNGYAMEFNETAGSTAPFDINTSIAPIHVVNPFFQRLLADANNYVTLTIPFNYTLPATDKAWTMSATSTESGLSVTFTEVAAGSTLTKNTPYLYFSSVGGVTMSNPGEVIIDWAAQTVDKTDASFVANYSRKVTDGTENIYVLPGVVKETALQFQKAGEVSIRPFRAYLQAASAPAKINVMFDDATGIHAATAEQLEGIFNIYSIDGKLVRQNGDKMGLNKGVYIINGKKVVVK